MDTISPVVADAFRLLHNDLYGHLDEAEFLALKCREWSQQDADTARTLIPDLVVVTPPGGSTSFTTDQLDQAEAYGQAGVSRTRKGA